MNHLISPGMYVLALTLMAGVWIAIAPFVLQTQGAEAGWSAATLNQVIVGGILIGVSLIGVCSHVVLAVGGLMRSSDEAPPSHDA